MKSFRALGFPLLLGLLAGCAVDGGPDTGSTEAPGRGDRVVATQHATVVVHYPTGWGHRISVRGSGAGLNWTAGRDATWTDGDAWVLALDLDKAIEIKPLFDDSVWSKGPNYALAPGQTIDVWPVFYHDKGRLERRARWHTWRLAQDRDIEIYLPPSYDENARERYPVVYMHDGQNLWDDASSFTGVSWDVAGAMDRGFQNATIHEAIVVGIDNTANRIWEYTPTDGGYGGGGASTYVGFIADELKPVIDRDYRTVPGAEKTGMIGSSLGGLLAAYAGVTRVETFGLIGAISPSTWWDGTWILAQVRAAAKIPVRVYVDSGDSGNSNDDVVNTATLAQTYRDRGATLQYVVQKGGTHTEYYWRQRLPGALAFLLGPR